MRGGGGFSFFVVVVLGLDFFSVQVKALTLGEGVEGFGLLAAVFMDYKSCTGKD